MPSMPHTTFVAEGGIEPAFRNDRAADRDETQVETGYARREVGMMEERDLVSPRDQCARQRNHRIDAAGLRHTDESESCQ